MNRKSGRGGETCQSIHPQHNPNNDSLRPAGDDLGSSQRGKAAESVEDQNKDQPANNMVALSHANETTTSSDCWNQHGNPLLPLFQSLQLSGQTRHSAHPTDPLRTTGLEQNDPGHRVEFSTSRIQPILIKLLFFSWLTCWPGPVSATVVFQSWRAEL